MSFCPGIRNQSAQPLFNDQQKQFMLGVGKALLIVMATVVIVAACAFALSASLAFTGPSVLGWAFGGGAIGVAVGSLFVTSKALITKNWHQINIRNEMEEIFEMSAKFGISGALVGLNLGVVAMTIRSPNLNRIPLMF